MKLLRKIVLVVMPVMALVTTPVLADPPGGRGYEHGDRGKKHHRHEEHGHGFSGGPKTHGQSERHRSPGSIGACTTPGRVFKGMRMAGRMGGERVTAQSLEVVLVDPERNLLAVKGSVPGAKNGLLLIRQARKSRLLKRERK